MALLAGQYRMFTQECKATDALMIEVTRPPVDGAMAASTIASVTTVMHVVIKMTGTAFTRDLRRGRTGRMTGIAGNGLMGSGQNKARPAVIKADRGPGDRAMAGRARGAEGALVHIVFLMTTAAFATGTDKALVVVALATGQRLMRANEGKSGRSMIETGCRPAHRVMALSALLSKRTLVRVRITVTGRTLGRRGALGFQRLMTADTGKTRVGAIEGKVRQQMIEWHRSRWIQGSIPSFMLSMAVLTGRGTHRRPAPMEPLFIRDVFAHLRMAGGTESSRRCVLPGRMTGTAVSFELRMECVQRSGSHQPFQCTGTERRATQAPEQQRSTTQSGKRRKHQYACTA